MDIKYILVIFSLLIIFSYIFDEIARKTKFPSVILLMATGILARAVADYFGVQVMYLDQIIPVMGTIGLILIVLEGALELEVRRDKLPIIIKGFVAALVILLVSVAAISYFFNAYLGMPKAMALMNAIPLAVISSAVAIPSANALSPLNKEFVVYESTFSDIIGIMVFNYAMRQFQVGSDLVGIKPIAILLVEIVVIVLVSVLVTWLLFELFERITHKVKFFLILALLILVYAIGKRLHMPSLVIIFIFGLFLSNAEVLLPDYIKRYISMGIAKREGLHEFHLLTAESTFLVRTFFFLFFGFSITLDSFVDGYNYIYGGIILAILLVIRFIYILVSDRKNIGELTFISPRGLITILLFLQLRTETVINNKTGEIINLKSTIINEKVLLIVILGSMLIMMIGTIGFGKQEEFESSGGGIGDGTIPNSDEPFNPTSYIDESSKE